LSFTVLATHDTSEPTTLKYVDPPLGDGVTMGEDAMGNGDDYECPECGASFAFGEDSCPGCGVDMDWDDVTAVEIGREPTRLIDPRLEGQENKTASPEPVFSRWGTVFALLTALGFLGTLLLLRWDTWVRGAPEDAIGDDQRILIYAGAVATTVFAILAILDIVRGQAKAASAPGSDT
jgi:hypothetical protein